MSSSGSTASTSRRSTRSRSGSRMSTEVLRGRLLLWTTALVLAVVVGLPAFRPALGGAGRVLVGPTAGLATFMALAGRPRRPPSIDRVLVARGLWLTAGAAFEELVWRGLALAALALRIGAPGALIASTTGFALAH